MEEYSTERYVESLLKLFKICAKLFWESEKTPKKFNKNLCENIWTLIKTC